MSDSAFYKIPVEIWDKVFTQIGRSELAALALTSKTTYPFANPRLYESLELSFCKCSEVYYNALARTIINNAELAALITSIVVDMNVPCKIKSLQNFHSTKSRTDKLLPFFNSLSGIADYRKYSSPKSPADWNQEAVQTLLHPRLSDILSHLFNVKRLTVILGLFKIQENSDVMSPLLGGLPRHNLQFLKICNASLTKTTSLRTLSSLRVLDLGYAAVASSQLSAMISRNARTLEEIRLHWFVEPMQMQLFTDYPGDALEHLKAFTSQGPILFSLDGLKKLLGQASSLEDLRLESLSVQSTVTWSQILSSLTEDDRWKAQKIRILRFGASTGCGGFWDSVAQFLSRCGNDLISLSINGSPRGSTGAFPSSLLKCFLDHPQPMLENLTLIWRDVAGVSLDSVTALATFAPSLKMLHLCLLFPREFATSLLGVIAPFLKLHSVHLVFSKNTRLVGADSEEAHIRSSSSYAEYCRSACEDIFEKGPMFQEFVRRAAAQHPELSEVSCSVYDRVSFAADRSTAYVKIKRPATSISNFSDSGGRTSDGNAFIILEDLGMECQKYEITRSFDYLSSVGTKKVLLTQKPGWREETGNPFLQNRRVCPYADFNGGMEERFPPIEL